MTSAVGIGSNGQSLVDHLLDFVGADLVGIGGRRSDLFARGYGWLARDRRSEAGKDSARALAPRKVEHVFLTELRVDQDPRWHHRAVVRMRVSGA